ncbi:hypothetical protein HPB52_011606 [Rhipicephalus sanguineus]|uniref:BEN domain-containing protein n=1 Tax=Rhipicephalus sanguineus TaxID=34632 RepID=A0A9D4Q0K3_RHISA|nr:hypothetical protein HPB52_011606 [Rhipicephalus sanguineus]
MDHHVLVKWIAEDKWDVYPLKSVVDAAIGMSLLEDTATTLDRLKDTAVEILWQAGEPTAPAKILAVDASRMEKRLHKMLDKASADTNVKVASLKVDIGNGVLVDETTLERIRKDSKKSGCRFARGLMRAVFMPEELTNKSLFGRKCNSLKGSVAKEALDPQRVKAVIGRYYEVTRRPMNRILFKVGGQLQPER